MINSILLDEVTPDISIWGIFLLILIAIAIYLLPTFLSVGKVQRSRIILVNLFFGWSLIGWLIALIWALTYPKIIYVSTFTYTCKRCGAIKSFEFPLKIYKCVQCGEENTI